MRRLSAACGAEISGANLRHGLDDATFALIRQALLDHGAIFFRDQDLDDVTQRDFAARFGPLDIFPFGERPTPEAPEVHVIAFEAGNDAEGKGADEWHSDVTFIETPPMGTMLRGHVARLRRRHVLRQYGRRL